MTVRGIQRKELAAALAGALLAVALLCAGLGVGGAQASAPASAAPVPTGGADADDSGAVDDGGAAGDAGAGGAANEAGGATEAGGEPGAVDAQGSPSGDGAASQQAAPFSASEEAPVEAPAVGDPTAEEAPAVGDPAAEGEQAGEPAAEVAVGPWLARFDAAALDRASRAAEVAFEADAAFRSTLAAGMFLAAATMCLAAGAACLIAARSLRRDAPQPVLGAQGAARPVGTARMNVTKRKEA